MRYSIHVSCCVAKVVAPRPGPGPGHRCLRMPSLLSAKRAPAPPRPKDVKPGQRSRGQRPTRDKTVREMTMKLEDDERFPQQQQQQQQQRNCGMRVGGSTFTQARSLVMNVCFSLGNTPTDFRWLDNYRLVCPGCLANSVKRSTKWLPEHYVSSYILLKFWFLKIIYDNNNLRKISVACNNICSGRCHVAITNNIDNG